MTKLELLPAALIAAAMLTTPVMARENHHQSARHFVTSVPDSATPAARYVDGRLCYPAPRVGAFATQPWDNETPCEPAMGY
jgi:hypothetical protein